MPLPSPRTVQTMLRELLEQGGSENLVQVRFRKTSSGPRWSVFLDPDDTSIGIEARGATLDQALRALVVKARRARGQKLGK